MRAHAWYYHLRAATENLEDLGMACHWGVTTAIFSPQSTAADKAFEQIGRWFFPSTAMVVCRKLIPSFKKGSECPYSCMTASEGGSSGCSPQPSASPNIRFMQAVVSWLRSNNQKELLNFNQKQLHFFAKESWPLHVLRHPCSLHLPSWPPCPPAAPPIALPAAPAPVEAALLPALPAPLMAPAAQGCRASRMGGDVKVVLIVLVVTRLFPYCKVFKF